MRFRHFSALVLALCLLLTACAPGPSNSMDADLPSNAPSTEPSQTTTPSTEPPTEPPIFGTAVSETDGALRALPLDIGVYCDAYLWGDTVLLYNDRKCQVRSLEDGSVLASAPGVGANAITVTEDYIISYSLGRSQIIFRDKSLEIVKAVDVNVSVDVSETLFSQDGSKAYYHIYPSNAIVELDIQTGQEREIPVDGAPIWMLSGLEFEGSVLRYWGKEDNQDYWAFVDLATGTYLGKDPTITRFQSWDGGYYLCRAENGQIFDQRMVSNGTGNGIAPQDRGTDFSDTWPLPQLDSFFTFSYSQESSTVILDLYNRKSNDCIASLTVDLGLRYQNSAEVFVDPSGQFIWLCLKVDDHSTNNNQMILYRWDYQANATTE